MSRSPCIGLVAADAGCAGHECPAERFDLFPGPSGQIYTAWRRARFELVTSIVQLDELRLASRYPKFRSILQPHRVGAMVNNMQRAIVLDRLPSGVEADDPEDSFLLAMATAGNADYLVTGDHRAGLLRLGHVGRARVVTPQRFCGKVL